MSYNPLFPPHKSSKERWISRGDKMDSKKSFLSKPQITSSSFHTQILHHFAQQPLLVFSKHKRIFNQVRLKTNLFFCAHKLFVTISEICRQPAAIFYTDLSSCFLVGSHPHIYISKRAIKAIVKKHLNMIKALNFEEAFINRNQILSSKAC